MEIQSEEKNCERNENFYTSHSVILKIQRARKEFFKFFFSIIKFTRTNCKKNYKKLQKFRIKM